MKLVFQRRTRMYILLTILVVIQICLLTLSNNINRVEAETEPMRSFAILIFVLIFVLGVLIFLTIISIVMNKYLQKVFEKNK